MITQDLAYYVVDNFFWMAWNILLAAVPLGLASRLFARKQKVTPVWMIGLMVFIVFLPNAPYILTDFIHLFALLNRFSSGVALVIFLVQFSAFELIGYWLFVKSYSLFERFLLRKVAISRTVFRIASFFMISVGVSLGRFARHNSWDIFIVPNAVLATVTSMAHAQVVFFIVFFTAVLYLLYQFHERFASEV